MKKLILAMTFLSLCSTQIMAKERKPEVLPEFKTCKELFYYQQDINAKRINGDALIMGMGITASFFSPIFTLAIFPIGAVKAVKHANKAIANKHLVQLITDSEIYVRKSEVELPTPGRQLAKLIRKIERAGMPVPAFYLAEAIVRGNKDRSLCPQSSMSLKKVEKAIESGDLKVLTLE